MSGPVSTTDAPAVAETGHATAPVVEVHDSREAVVGRFPVRRALPRRGRRTVGAWCFADHMGPASVTEDAGLDVGPHPHIGLQTVTWLLDGEALHRDGLGSEQVIKPGQLNLMTSGGGLAHAEEATGHYRGELEGVQLWVALPAATRDGAAAFEHHGELPRADIDGGGIATVLLGESAGLTSPARHDSPLVGVDLDLYGDRAVVPLRPDWEHGLVVLRGAVGVDDRPLGPGRFAYIGRGREELALEVGERARVLLVGGEPFDEQIVMWWNFVARSRDEITAAWQAWRDETDRFAPFVSSLRRVPAPTPPWVAAS